PQNRQKWMEEISMSRRDEDGDLTEILRMLILDVRTRWASTHQMLHKLTLSLDYRSEIDSFVAKNKDIRQYELAANDWDAIALATGWLKAFRSATTQMSATKHTTYSSQHAVLKGLQDHIAEQIRLLPAATSPKVCEALIACHRKLSDYLFKIDMSPYPIWSMLLDPRINYKDLLDDHVNEEELLDHIKDCKRSLESHYTAFYAGKVSSITKAPQWWGARRAQFPNLSYLARDLMSIPGSAVAVERIFSSGRDVISLRRASLKPDTIRTLMLVKQRLRLAWEAVKDVLGDD
ncbi:hypothetical protein M422DRAFT_171816, partial [Sphaerobolus stellatus SS14]